MEGEEGVGGVLGRMVRLRVSGEDDLRPEGFRSSDLRGMRVLVGMVDGVWGEILDSGGFDDVR